jgi:uncharacterized radical SAM superfamily Fe-S cluster-containing enzyme
MIDHQLRGALRVLADFGWGAFQAVNRHVPVPPSLPAGKAAEGLGDSRAPSSPPPGWPRRADSLCPRCVIETRAAILRGDGDLADLIGGHPGEIKAEILEEDGRLVMRKHCVEHGAFEDVLSIDPGFSALVERRATLRRGAVLTIDLTSRCGTMCSRCFIDARHVGTLHALTLEEIREILEASAPFQARRRMTVQFSGGEPTTSPHFLEACRYAKDVGYLSVQAETNGVRFAVEPQFAVQAREAGLDVACLQIGGLADDLDDDLDVSPPFDVQQRSIEVMCAAGIDIVPVMTVVGGVNSDQVGPVLDFVVDNCDRMGGVSFRLLSFTGPDEEISDAERARRRYTVSHVAHEMKRYYGGKIDPYRDWFPLGTLGAFCALGDHLRSLRGHARPGAGNLPYSCHADGGAGVLLVANREAKTWSTVTQFFDVERCVHDLGVIGDAARGRPLTLAQVALSFARNFDASKAPPGLTLGEFTRLLCDDGAGGLRGARKREGNWTVLWVGGTWLQDLWTYDLAYDAGLGWRQIVESMHSVARAQERPSTRSRQRAHAGDKPLPPAEKRKGRVLGMPAGMR